MSEHTSGAEATLVISKDQVGETSKKIVFGQKHQNNEASAAICDQTASMDINKTEVLNSSPGGVLKTATTITDTDSGSKYKSLKKDSLKMSETNLSQNDNINNSLKPAPVSSGVKKFLELMNLLNKHPEKCQKWLKGQDLLRKKLGEKYKPPIIYLTVKQIAQSQSGQCNEMLSNKSKESGAPKVQNTLDLLNILYLNPDKCNNWLKNQEVLKKKHGDKYQEPIIYSTVTEIAMHHFDQSTAASKLEGYSKNAIHIEIPNKIASQLKETPQHQKTEISPLMSKAVTKHLPLIDNNPLQNSKKLNATKDTSEINPIFYVLFSPKLPSIKDCSKMASRQINVAHIIGNQFRMPRYNSMGKKISFWASNAEFTFVQIPCEESHKITFRYPKGFDEFSGLNWLKSQLILIEKLGYNRYTWPKYNSEGYLMETNFGIIESSRGPLPGQWAVPSFEPDPPGCEPTLHIVPPLYPNPTGWDPTPAAVIPPLDPVPPGCMPTPLSALQPINSDALGWRPSAYAPGSTFRQDPTFTATPFCEARALPVVAQPLQASSETTMPSMAQMYPTTVNSLSAGPLNNSAAPTVKTVSKEKDSKEESTSKKSSKDKSPLQASDTQKKMSTSETLDTLKSLKCATPDKDFVINDSKFLSTCAFFFKGKSVKYPLNLANTPNARRRWIARQLSLYKNIEDKNHPQDKRIPRVQASKTSQPANPRPHLKSRERFRNATKKDTKDKPSSTKTGATDKQDPVSRLRKWEETNERNRPNFTKEIKFDKCGMRINPNVHYPSDVINKKNYDLEKSEERKEKKSLQSNAVDKCKSEPQSSTTVKTKSVVKMSDVFNSPLSIPKVAKVLKKIEVNLKVNEKKENKNDQIEKDIDKIEKKPETAGSVSVRLQHYNLLKTDIPSDITYTETQNLHDTTNPADITRDMASKWFTEAQNRLDSRTTAGIPRAMASKWFTGTHNIIDTKTTGHENLGQTLGAHPPRANVALPIYKGKPLFPTMSPGNTTPPLPSPVPPPALQTQLQNAYGKIFQPTKKTVTAGRPPSTFNPTALQPACIITTRQSASPLKPPTYTEPERTLGKSKPSAFERLGPVVAEPKKPKLTINLMFGQDENKEDVREVVEEHVPVFLRQDILASTDNIVKAYLNLWPWSRPIRIMHEASFQSSDLLLDEFEMVGCYKSKSAWIKVVVTGYAPHMKKEDVLDVLLNSIGKVEFIPCFIEFKPSECVFLLNRSERALTYLHKKGLICERDGTKLNLVVSQTNLTLENLRFYKGAVFKAKLNEAFIEDINTLNLAAFQLQPDNSHFMYFPLNYDYNQTFIMKVVKAMLPWEFLTMVDLSDNRLTSINSFDFPENMPALRHLNLSGNWLPTVSTLACIKGTHLYSLKLEGNPLCRNFIEKEHYIEVVRLLFPKLRILDGIKINSNVDPKRHFTVAPETQEFVNSFLEIFFRFMDSNDRSMMAPIYSDNAVFSITCPKEMKRNPMYKNLKEFYMWCRTLQDSINPSDLLEGAIVGGPKIVKYFTKWPTVMHDPYTFTVDVMLHTESSMIIKVAGLIKIPAESLDQDEPIIEFSRTFVLITDDGTEYKISNDMMQISEASTERIAAAFKFVGQQGQKCTEDLNLKFDCPPDEDLKDKLTEVFMEITRMSKKSSERCLDMEYWNLRKALEYFIKLEKHGSTQTLEY